MKELNARLLVGIDFSRNRADLALLQPDGQLLDDHIPFPNSYPGFLQAKARLLATLAEHAFQGVDIAGEATSYYWLPFFQQLAGDEELAAYDLELFLLNPRWVRGFKQGLSPDHKTDDTDPRYIADYVRYKRPPTAWQPDPKWLSLRFLTRLRRHLSQSLVRSKNLAQVYLFLLYPTYSRRKPFSDSFSRTSQRLLSQPELLAELPEMELEDLTAKLDELSRHRLADPRRSAQVLQQVVAESFPPHPVLEGVIQTVLKLLLETINRLQEQIKQLDQHISQHVQSGYPEVAWLQSIPGIGPVFASGLAAEIGDIQRFAQVPKWDKKRKCLRPRDPQEITDAVAKMAGLWWQKNASGEFVAEERRMSKAGNAYLRYYILEAAESLRRHLPSYTAYYQQKYNETAKHKHKRALVLTGRKALGLFVRLLLRQETYRAKEVAGSSA